MFRCCYIYGFNVEETTSEKNPLGYIISIEWFPYDSDANKVANYWYKNSSWNLDMIATFMAEAMFNKDAHSHTNDYWICQLQYNRTNKVWIDDPRWSDIMYQAQICLEKWNAVPQPSKLWYGWNRREEMKSKILFIND